MTRLASALSLASRHRPLDPVVDTGRPDEGVPCIRASGRHLIVNGCEFMDEGKQAIVLDKGLAAATILGCAFRGQNPVEDHSGADVKVGLNTSV